MDTKITFQELIDKIAARSGYPKSHIHDLLKETIQLTSESLAQDGESYVKGLGRFQVKSLKARRSRNPQTGEMMTIPSHKTVHFHPESKLRQFINRNYAHLTADILPKKEPVLGAPVAQPAPVPEPPPVPEWAAEPVVFEPTRPEPLAKQTRAPGWWWLILPIAVVVLVLLLWQPWQMANPPIDSQPTVTQPAVIQPTVDQPQTAPVIATQPDTTPAPTVAATHLILPGETLSKLSRKYYQVQEYWPVIFLENRIAISDPDLIPAGMELIIPGMEGEPGFPTLKDREKLGIGYMEAYQAYKAAGKEDAGQFAEAARRW